MILNEYSFSKWSAPRRMPYRKDKGANCGSAAAQCGKALPFRSRSKYILRLRLMHVISRDSPCFYLTSVAKDRLPVYQISWRRNGGRAS